jgi:hypothetical protein
MRKLIDGLVEKLFEAERRRLAGEINELNSRNKKLKNSTIDGFMYGGDFYAPFGVAMTVVGKGQAKQTLHFQLNNEMDAWVREQKSINDDQTLIKQMLFCLLKPCQSERDIRNALPECLVSLVQGLNQHPRADEAGYTLRGDERGLRQFNKLLPKMELYSATRLLY